MTNKTKFILIGVAAIVFIGLILLPKTIIPLGIGLIGGWYAHKKWPK